LATATTQPAICAIAQVKMAQIAGCVPVIKVIQRRVALKPQVASCAPCEGRHTASILRQKTAGLAQIAGCVPAIMAAWGRVALKPQGTGRRATRHPASPVLGQGAWLHVPPTIVRSQKNQKGSIPNWLTNRPKRNQKGSIPFWFNWLRAGQRIGRPFDSLRICACG